MTIKLRPVKIPNFGISLKQPQIPGVVFEARARAALAMAGTDWLVVYADREHFSSIAFLTGFEPRFEEAFLLLGRNDCRILLVGNESASYAVWAGLPAIEIMVAQSLSLMGQDRSHSPRLLDKFRQAGIKAGDSVGLVGWKYLEPYEDEIQSAAFFVPAVYVSMLRRAVG